VFTVSDDRISICSVQKLKYLGISIDANLTCKYDRKDQIIIIQICKTLNNILSSNIMRMVFIAIAQSLYSYGIDSWSSAYNTHVNSLETTINSIINISFKNTIGRVLYCYIDNVVY